MLYKYFNILIFRDGTFFYVSTVIENDNLFDGIAIDNSNCRFNK